MNAREFEVHYYKRRAGCEREWSHTYKETWLPTNLYCPSCGKAQVHRCNNGGDYYVGEQYICVGCSNTFYLPGGIQPANDEQDTQRLQALNTA